MRDEVSLSRAPVYHEFPGKARMCYDNVVLPFVWNDREKVKWCYDERYFMREREIELFDVSRSYEELLERINSERVNKIKNLPCCENSAAMDDNIDNYIEYLPCLLYTSYVCVKRSQHT